MQPSMILFVTVAVSCCFVVFARGEDLNHEQQQLPALEAVPEEQDNDLHTRTKRTLFLKKKLLGAGLLGFGLGAVKGFKLGYHQAPEVHHVYVAPPPPAVKYVEYLEKPVYVERIVERPVFKPSPEYEPSWSPPEPSTSYGTW